MFSYNEAFWLIITNLILGLATLVCLLVIGYTAIKEIRQRIEGKANESEAENVDGLGLAMAEGGMFTEDVLKYLNKQEILLLYNVFFSPRMDGATSI